MTTTNDLVNKLPKPETLEEQYMYALVCSVAGVTPKYGVASDAAFKRLEQYWKAFWLVASKKFTDLETPAANTVSNEAIRNNAVTTEKLGDNAVTADKVATDITSRLWAENRAGSVVEAYLETSVRNKLLGSLNVQTENLANSSVTGAKIASGVVSLSHLDAELQEKIGKIK